MKGVPRCAVTQYTVRSTYLSLYSNDDVDVDQEEHTNQDKQWYIPPEETQAAAATTSFPSPPRVGGFQGVSAVGRYNSQLSHLSKIPFEFLDPRDQFWQ